MIELGGVSLFRVVGWVLLIGAMAHVGLSIAAIWRSIRFDGLRRSLKLQLLNDQVTAFSHQANLEQDRSNYSWNGLRKLRISHKKAESDDICSFHLVAHDNRPLPPFLPGQYLTFSLMLPNMERPVTRCYSLSNSPGEREKYRVTIKRLASPKDRPELPDGQVSGFFHDTLQEGDIVDAKAPMGRFFLDVTQHKNCVLIGGGIGITPVYAMLRFVVDAKGYGEIHFFYGVRNIEEQIWGSELQAISQEHENVHIHLSYSQTSPKNSGDGITVHHGRIDLGLLQRELPSSNYDFFMCGPAAMMEELNQGLQGWGVPKGDINYEAFGPASVKTSVGVGNGESRKVNFSRSDKELVWSGEGTLLDLADAGGIPINSGCRAGQCNSCVTAVKSGKVTYVTEPTNPPDSGSCLVCLAAPETDLVMDA